MDDDRVMELFIKSMVSLRCKLMVKQELKKLGLRHGAVDLGTVDVTSTISEEQHRQLKRNLLAVGLEVLENKKSILVERIVNVITQMIHDTDDLPQMNYSAVISEKLDYDYTYLSKLFSEMRGITLQKFIIIRKVEKIKELLLYKELNLTEISQRLHYSSVGHLSNQFKKVTGFSPSLYQQLNQKRQDNLENTGHV